MAERILPLVVDVVLRDSESGTKYGVRVVRPRVRYRPGGFLGFGKSIPYHDGYCDPVYAGYDMHGFPSLRHHALWGDLSRANRLADLIRGGALEETDG